MADKNQRTVACPKCGRKQSYRTADALYFCCGRQFDDSPDEGGDYFSDPTKRLELADEARVKRQNRTRARLGGR